MQTETATSERAGPNLAPLIEALPAWRAMTGSRVLAGLTVLLVEDSRFASEAVRLLCLRSGARIRRADCLASARRHLAIYRPAVVIVDMGLPDGDGGELIAELVRLAPRVPVVLGLSGDPDTRTAAMAAGAHGFLGKPVESLAVFQQAILGALPSESRPLGLRALPSDIVLPDVCALRDDLAHVAATLSDAPPQDELRHVVRFTAGLARSARDSALAEAAAAVLLDDAALDYASAAVGRLQRLVEQRLREVEPM